MTNEAIEFASGFYTMATLIWFTYLSFMFKWHPTYERLPV